MPATGCMNSRVTKALDGELGLFVYIFKQLTGVLLFTTALSFRLTPHMGGLDISTEIIATFRPRGKMTRFLILVILSV